MNCKISKLCSTLLLLACFLMSLSVAKAQRSAGPVQKDSVLTIIGELDPSKMSQTRIFTVPVGVTSVKIQCWGAGAAGAFMNAPGLGHDPRAGVGGGGGAYACINSLSVTPGQTLTVVIGQGGYGSTDIHGNGGDTYVQYGGVTKVLAKGAEAVADDERAAVGKGGKAAHCIGDVKHNGGNGGKGEKGNWAGSGAGGGVAGASGDGHNGGNGVQPAMYELTDHPSAGGAPGAGYPFSSPNTGYGANGVVSHTNGTNGKNAVNYGGGGSGGATSKKGSAFGGDGGDGVVIISYEQCQADAGSIVVSAGCVVVINSQTDASGTEGVYFWEKSASGTGAWTVIAGATNKDLTPTDNGWYHRGYTTVCGNTIYTDPVQVTGLGVTTAPGFVSIAGSPTVTAMTACYDASVNKNLAANSTGATELTWECSVGGGAWGSMATKSATETYTVSIPSIQQNTKYRYKFLKSAGCFVYSSNEFTITVDTGVIGRPDFYFDNDTVRIVMQYGDRDTMPYISAPTFHPSTGVTLSNNTPLGTTGVNEGYLLGRVGAGTYTIEWTVSDCGKTRTKTYNKVYMVLYPKCGESYKAMDADDNLYNTVRIGAECWTRENLRTLHFNSGDTILNSRIYASKQHNDTSANLATYGRLYNWYTAAAVTPLQIPIKNLFGHIEGVCPEGWVLPTEKQYRDLYVYDSRELRSTNLWLDGEGTNLTGMTMLPGGCYNAASGRCEDLLGYAYFWSDMETVGEKSFAFWVDCLCYQLQKTEYNKNNEMSVRCVKEKTPYVPIVLTKAVSGIGSGAATFNGVVTDGGALKVLDRGFCYGTTEMPSLENGTVVHAATAGTGAYSVPVSGLTEAGYYVRAYAVNAEGIAYGEQVSFGTVVHHSDTITFMPNGAMGGTMSQQVVTRGVATTLSANQYTHGAPEAPDTNWTFMGWNTHALGYGTSYADGANITTNGNDTLHAQWHTWCNGTAIDGESGSTGRVDSVKDADNNWYQVVQIGNQCWLKENLKTTKYADGTVISSTYPQTDTSSTTAYWYYPNGDPTNKKTYGLLYNWKAVMNGSDSTTANPSGVQGVCPNGWHVPSSAEFTQLKGYVNQRAYQCDSTDNYILKALASTTSWPSFGSGLNCKPGNNPSANNATGFSAVTAGHSANKKYSFGLRQVLYSTSYCEPNKIYTFSCTSADYSSSFMPLFIQAAASVRCVRNLPVNDTITFMPNGAMGGTMSQQVVTRGVATTLSANQFTHGAPEAPDTNWTFMGWNTHALGYGTSYADGANITTNGNDTLHAQWHTWCNGTARTGEMGTGRVDSVQDIDGNWYKVVQIGNQCWLKENLKTTRYANGDYISKGASSSTTTAYRYFPNNDTNNVAVYGHLYNWTAAVDSTAGGKRIPSGVQGICPDGWHVPSDSEWTQLTNYVNQSAYQCGSTNKKIAKALASTTGWISKPTSCNIGNNQSSNNTTGFTAVPASSYEGNYSNVGSLTGIWSATNRGSSAGIPILNAISYEVPYNSTRFKGFGYSVRCVRNSQTPE